MQEPEGLQILIDSQDIVVEILHPGGWFFASDYFHLFLETVSSVRENFRNRTEKNVKKMLSKKQK